MKKSFRKKSVAQSSLETIIIVSIALFILTALVGITYDQIDFFNAQQSQKIASIAINSIVNEVNDVYFLGPGSVKTIVVRLPDGIDFEKSFIEGRTIWLNVYGSDVFASTSVDVRGIWPGENGTYSFTLSAYDDYVSISIRPVDVVPNSVNEYLVQGESKNFDLVLSNGFDEDKYYSIVIDFPFPSSTDVNLTSTHSGLVEVFYGEIQTLNFSINCTMDSFGSYNGKIIFVPRDFKDSNITVPVNLFCSSLQTKLKVYPSSKYFYTTTNSVTSDSVLVCNTTSRDFASSSSSVSGSLAPYVVTSFSGPILANSCSTLNFVLNAPSTVSSYLGSLVVKAGGYTSGVDLNLLTYYPSDAINFSWDDAYFGTDGKSINGINIDVLVGPFVITSATVLFLNDIDDANVTALYLSDLNTVAGGYKLSSGEWMDLIDFNLARRKSYDLNIIFDASINNDSEKFRLILKSSDGTYFWSPIFDPTNTIIDNNASHFSNLTKGQEPIYPKGNHLVSLWRMNDLNSSNYTSDVLKRNSAHVISATQAKGLWDTNTLNFDGSNSYIEVLENDSLDLTNQWTISAWINRRVMGAQHGIVEKYLWNDNKGVFALRVTSGDKLLASVINGNSSSTCGETKTTLNSGTWYNVAATFDTNNNLLNCYVNGVLEASNPAATLNPTPGDSTLKIGARGDDASYKFNGLIEEVAIWDTNLSSEEIKEIYSIGSGVHDFNTFADGNGLYLARGSDGNFVSDGNFYSRVFNFNEKVDFSQMTFNKIGGSDYFLVKDNNLNNDFSKSSFVYRRTDNNSFTATGELDSNILDRGEELISSNSLYDVNLIGLWHLNNNALNSVNKKNFIVNYGSGDIGVLVVGGGGGGGADQGGGGGAGGYVYATYSVSQGTSYPIVVGAGGNGAPPGGATGGKDGSSSNAFGFIAGGGKGGKGLYRNGPSGGDCGSGTIIYIGGRAYGDISGGAGGAGVFENGSNASSSGKDSPSGYAGNGGIGNSLLGFSFGGGGGGGNRTQTQRGIAIEEYGGGNGGYCENGFSAIENTGGGGGGGAWCGYQYGGGNGGSGIVIVRYLTGSINATGGTITTEGNYTIHTFKDITTNFADGIWSGTESYSSGMWDTNAGLFNGTNARVSTPDLVGLHNTRNLTLSAWIFPTTSGSVFCENGNSGWTDNQIEVVGTNMKYKVWNTSTLSIPGVKLNSWNFVSLVYDDSLLTLTGYLNGTSSTISVTQRQHPILDGGQSTYTYGIGQNGGTSLGANAYFSGRIDEVKIYNRALSSSEIISDYSSFLNSKFVDSNIIYLDSNVKWNSVKLNSDVNYSFGKEISVSEKFSTGLIGLWHLNNNALDALGMHNGTWGGTVSYSTGFWNTNAGNFNGSSSYINVGSLGAFPSRGTISFWMNPSVIESYRNPFTTKYLGGNAGIRFEENSSGNFTVVVGNDAGSYNYHTYIAAGMKANTWYHVVYIWDRVANIGTGFLNGVKVFSASHTLWPTTIPNLSMGNGYSSSRYWKGKLEEVAIWNRALTDSEVIDLYRLGVSRLDLNVYSCADENCQNKTSSKYITGIQNGSWIDLNISNSQYLGFDVFFKKASGLEDYNSETFWINSFIKDITFDYSKGELDLYARGSSNGYSWSDWSSKITYSPNSLSLLDANFFQYKTVISTMSPTNSPILRDVNITYTRLSN